MSGVTGGNRINRQDVMPTVNDYLKKVLSKFPGYVSAAPSGSFNAAGKDDFGDIDLIVHFRAKDKTILKAELVKFFAGFDNKTIVPFLTQKNKGKKSHNSGEIVTVMYPQKGAKGFVQIDNIVALDKKEAGFKQSLLDMSAEKQGLLFGAAKIAAIEENPKKLLKRMGIPFKKLQPDQEYEFTLSTVSLSLRIVTLKKFREIKRETLWKSAKWADVEKLFVRHDISQGFNFLLKDISAKIRNSKRSPKRMIGIFKSMITVKSGEVGTAKGLTKIRAQQSVEKTFGESEIIRFRPFFERAEKSITFTFGRFQPPTTGHAKLIEKVKAAGNHIVFVSQTQDKKQNPLSFRQKLKFLKIGFPGIKFSADKKIKTPFDALEKLSNSGFKNVTMVVGQDRIQSFENAVKPFLNNPDKDPNLQFDTFKVVSAGTRDPDGPGIEGVSASKMRTFAKNGNTKEFRQFLPAGLNILINAEALIIAVRRGMGLK